MRTCKRILALCAFFLGLVVLLVSLTVGVGVWVVKEKVTSRATEVLDRVESKLGTGQGALDHVKTSLDNASKRLEAAREEQTKSSQVPAPGVRGLKRRVMARTIANQVAPELEDARGTFETVAEAALVANSVMADMGNFPLLADSGVNPEQLSEIKSRLSQVETSAWELSRHFSDSETQSEDGGDQVSRVDDSLNRLRERIAEIEPRLAAAREKAATLRSRISTGITIAAVVTSIVSLWIAISQLSVMIHAWSLWRRQSTPA